MRNSRSAGSGTQSGAIAKAAIAIPGHLAADGLRWRSVAALTGRRWPSELWRGYGMRVGGRLRHNFHTALMRRGDQSCTRRRGVADEDIVHALEHAMARGDAGEDSDRWLVIGPDRAGTLESPGQAER